jgi:hypothetical protein
MQRPIAEDAEATEDRREKNLNPGSFSSWIQLNDHLYENQFKLNARL